MSGRVNHFSEFGDAAIPNFRSKEDFAAEYKKRISHKEKAEELYIHVLRELKNSLKEGNFDSFKLFGDFIECVTSLEDVTTLKTFHSNSNNPIGATNLVILTCKHNSLKILNYLFSSVSKVLQNLTVGVGNKPILPDDEDEMRHNAFYYAIRSSNVELLGILINKWPCNYFSTHKEKLNEIVSNAYEELLIKNVLLSEDMTIYVEKELVNIRFYPMLPNKENNVENTLDCIRERVAMVRDSVNQLQMEYLGNKNVDAKFLFIAKFVTQNIYILKHQLKSTYDRLPWEEIEFCLVRYISYQNGLNPEKTGLLCDALLSKSKILNFLLTFTDRLTYEVNGLDRDGTFTNLPNVKHEQIIADIIAKCPEFGDLYTTYKKIRNVHSLVKITENLELALSADPEQRQGQLIITRVLHNISELLKNTLDSPNLSTSFGEFLLLSIPPKTRSILIDFRNSNSYSDSFFKRIKLAQTADVNFFVCVQNDFKRLNFIVQYALHCHDRFKAFRMLLQSIVETNNMAEMEKKVYFLKEYAELLKGEKSELLELLVKEFYCERDLKLIQRLQRNERVSQLVLVDRIKRNGFLFDLKSVNGIEMDDFKRLMSIGTSLKNEDHHDNALTEFKSLATKLNTKISFREKSQRSMKLKELLDLCLNLFIILTGCEKNDDLNSKLAEIVFIVVFGIGDWEWAAQIKKRLFEIRPLLAPVLRRSCSGHIDLKDKYEKLLTEKVSELKTILSENSYTDNYIDNIKIYLTKKKVLTAIEMLLLDILSIMNGSTKDTANDHNFLDDDAPLLLGKGLLHHLAHENSLLDIMPHDPSIALILNAKKVVRKLGKKIKKGQHISNTADIPSLKMKYTRNLIHLTHQEQMFAALEEGNLENLKATMKEGADINARNAKLWSALHFAAKGPSLSVVKFVLEQNLNINAVGFGGERPIHTAAANGRKKTVEFFVKRKGVHVDEIDEMKNTPLHFAAGNGHIDTINVLLDSSADPKCKSAIGFSPLHYAICNDSFGVARTLLQREANVDINETLSGQTCLHLAASNGHLETVKFLLTNGGNVNAKDFDESTPIHVASENGHVDVVKTLIVNGANVNPRKLSGESPLYLATKNNHKEIVDILLENEAKVNDTTKNGCTPLHIAALLGHEEVVRVLLKNMADACATNDIGETPLYSATINGHTKVAELLAGYGVNTVTKSDFVFMTPLHIAAFQGYKKLVEILIKNKGDVNNRAFLNRTPLHFAAEGGSKDVIDVLIKNKAQIDPRDNTGMTPLSMAASCGNEIAAELLIKCKAEVNLRDIGGHTPLHRAVQGGSKETVRLLLQNGAEVNAKERFTNTPIHLAVLECKEDIFDVLIAHPKAQINIRNSFSFLLHHAVLHNHKKMVKSLIRFGDKVNADYGGTLYVAVFNGLSDIAKILLQNTDRININNQKMTPLHMAAKNGHTDLVNMFIKRGACVNAKNFSNVTPLCCAAEEGHDEVAEILISNGADINSTDLSISPLHIAAFYGHCCVVDALIHHGAKTNLKDRHGRTALEVAITRNNFEVFEILLKSTLVKKDTMHSECSTILHIASEGNNLKMVEYLVDEGCDINARNEFYSKAMHIAASKGHIDIVTFFLRKGLSINERGSENRTLLHLAAQNGHTELVRFLIEEKADIDAKDDDENTPMHLTAATDETSTTRILLKNGATFNAANKYHMTPLAIAKNFYIKHLLIQTQNLFDATQHNNWSEVEKLITQGAIVNAKKVGGGVPLHFAAWKGYDKVANILLKSEGDPNAVDNKGWTPLHYAAKFSHLKTVKLLLAHGAVYNVVSSTGKTPSELTTDWHVGNLLNLIAKSFQNVAENKCDVVADLNKITDIATIRAVMCARNVEQKTLLIIADQYNFSKVEELTAVSQDVLRIKLASMAFEDGDHVAALPLNSMILKERMEILGPNNPATLAAAALVADSLNQLDRHDKALKMYEKINEEEEAIFGLNHKITLRSRCNIARTLLLLKRYEAALDIFQDHFHKVRKIHGLQHEDTLDTQLFIGEALNSLEKLEEAIILYKSVHKNLSGKVGKAAHNLSIKAQKGIARILAKQSKCEESREMFKEILEKEIQIWGSESIETSLTATAIALLDLEQNRRKDVSHVFQKVWPVLKNILGETHERTLNSQFYIGLGFLSVGNFISALQVFADLFELTSANFCTADESFVPTGLHIFENIAMIKLRYKLGSSDPAEMLGQLYNNFKIAARNGKVKTIQRFIEDGIDVNKKDGEGITPLHYAVSNGHIDVVDILLRNKANVADVSPKGNTTIHTAVSKGYKDIVEVLLKNVKPDKLSELIDAETTATRTAALHLAAEKGYFAIAKCLLENGATYNMKNKEGKTPIDLSQNKGISNLLTLIEELFKCAKSGGREDMNKLQEIRPDDLKAVVNARSSNQGSLVQVTKDERFARQLMEMLQKPT